MNLIAIFLTVMVNAAISNAFTISSIPRAHVARFGESTGTQMRMGFFDGIAKAFSNEEVSNLNLCTIVNSSLVLPSFSCRTHTFFHELM